MNSRFVILLFSVCQPCLDFRLTPTESEKEKREYELGLARAVMGKISKESKDQSAREFSSLQWQDEARLASKRRKIEDEKADEVLCRKQDALRSVEDDDGGSEAEEDGTKQPKVPVGPLPKPKEDVVTPKEVIRSETGNYLFSYFRFSICQNNIQGIKYRKCESG